MSRTRRKSPQRREKRHLKWYEKVDPCRKARNNKRDRQQWKSAVEEEDLLDEVV